jgi:hypothetical protein
MSFFLRFWLCSLCFLSWFGLHYFFCRIVFHWITRRSQWLRFCYRKRCCLYRYAFYVSNFRRINQWVSLLLSNSVDMDDPQAVVSPGGVGFDVSFLF